MTGTVLKEEPNVYCCFPFQVFVISLIPQIVLTMVKRWEGISLKTVNKTKGVATSRRSEVTSLVNYLSLCRVIEDEICYLLGVRDERVIAACVSRPACRGSAAPGVTELYILLHCRLFLFLAGNCYRIRTNSAAVCLWPSS